MSDEREESAEEKARKANYESTPISRTEYISAIVHLYRGELHRATSWRMRLDNTTNWAVLTTAGFFTFAFQRSDPADVLAHWVLLFGMALVTIFLSFEARRFRFADVWHARVRKIEENFYGPILRRDPTSPELMWGDLVAEDLFQPRFKLSKRGALRARFLRNYWPIYGVMLLGWGLKVAIHPNPVGSWHDLKANLGAGPLPWWLPLAYLLALFGTLFILFVTAPGPPEQSYDWGADRQPVRPTDA